MWFLHQKIQGNRRAARVKQYKMALLYKTFIICQWQEIPLFYSIVLLPCKVPIALVHHQFMHTFVLTVLVWHDLKFCFHRVGSAGLFSTMCRHWTQYRWTSSGYPFNFFLKREKERKFLNCHKIIHQDIVNQPLLGPLDFLIQLSHSCVISEKRHLERCFKFGVKCVELTDLSPDKRPLLHDHISLALRVVTEEADYCKALIPLTSWSKP